MKANLKYVAITAATLLSLTRLHAQLVTGGFEGGITTTSVRISNINTSFLNVINGKDVMGYEVGPYLRFGFGPVYIKPGALIGYQSGTVQAVYPDQSSTNVMFNVTKLDIPVLVGLKIVGPLSIEAGPVYNYIISATSDFNGNTVDIASNGLGYRVGANAQFGILGLNVSYQGIKNSAGSSTTYSSYETPDELIFGISIRF